MYHQMELNDLSISQNILIFIINEVFEHKLIFEDSFIKNFVKQGMNSIDKNGDFTIVLKPFNEMLSNVLNSEIRCTEDYFDKSPMISKTEVFKENLKIFLNKKIILSSIMPKITSEFWRCTTLSKYNIHILTTSNSSSEKDSLTRRRCHLIAHQLNYFLNACGASVKIYQDKDSSVIEKEEVLNSPYCLNYEIAESFNTKMDNSRKVILCSAVVRKGKNGTKLQMNSEEYMNLLKEELKRASLHKDGFTENSSFESYIHSLAVGCLNLQLLSVGHSSTVKVDLEEDSQNSRESSFILYNHARLCSLFNNFELLIKKEIIPPLPPISDVDFTVLKYKEEWELFWVFIVKFPELIKEVTMEVVRASEDTHQQLSKIPTHAVAKFLHRLSHCLSVYYNRVHILPSFQGANGKAVAHLLPVLWARIYLLKVLHSIMICCFESMHINPPSVM